MFNRSTCQRRWDLVAVSFAVTHCNIARTGFFKNLKRYEMWINAMWEYPMLPILSSAKEHLEA
jgi:hypothetical protein